MIKSWRPRRLGRRSGRKSGKTDDLETFIRPLITSFITDLGYEVEPMTDQELLHNDKFWEALYRRAADIGVPHPEGSHALKCLQVGGCYAVVSTYHLPHGIITQTQANRETTRFAFPTIHLKSKYTSESTPGSAPPSTTSPSSASRTSNASTNATSRGKPSRRSCSRRGRASSGARTTTTTSSSPTSSPPPPSTSSTRASWKRAPSSRA